MNHNRILRVAASGLAILAALVAGARFPALAHESVTAGSYTIEYGWLNEPIFEGQPNALVINIGEAEGEGTPAATEVAAGEHAEEEPHAEGVEVDVSDLKVEVSYGGETKTLSLEPLGADQPGHFLAPLVPTRAGQYTVRLTGNLGGEEINLEVEPEEVESAELVQFPSVSQEETSELESALSLTRTLAILGLVSGLLGLGLILFVVIRKS